ncbi:alpha-keto acid decarboxylase family protein [Lentisphaerota bacterium ZTH]|nr:alpha-keto acid decarboxylase family protein [Lentisphaerota bacterium]WET07460.1 alpha-keto acid decarboxylase family protein [Lentisphaerota bacterium ZTH]
MHKVTLAEHLLTRLKELNIEHIFGVPGDYNLSFLERIVDCPDMEWIGNCNELNASYAADGYARVRGASALVTTFGVGELSAVNGLAGAFSEHVPIISIVGMPSTAMQHGHVIVHHTLGNTDFRVFAEMSGKVTCGQAILNQDNAATAIDELLTRAVHHKRPVYIGIPSDMFMVEVKADSTPLKLSQPESDPNALNEAVAAAAKLINRSERPVMLIDLDAERFAMKSLIKEFLKETNFPAVTRPLGKGVVDESYHNFLGFDSGNFSVPALRQRLEGSDCIVTCGTKQSDFNTGNFTSTLNLNSVICIQSGYVRVRHAVFDNVFYTDFIPALKDKLKRKFATEPLSVLEADIYTASDKPVTQERFWQRAAGIIKPDSILVCEVGTSLFGLFQRKLPDNVKFVGSVLWASIGYSVGALLGASLAARRKEAVLFVGDGSLQLTAQALSTMLRLKLNPVIFVINNQGYTVERVIHGAHKPFNDIMNWQYTKLPETFNGSAWTARVSTELELETALGEIEKHKEKLRLIEVVMDKFDAPELLQKIGSSCADLNRY